jgi:twinkle protein
MSVAEELGANGIRPRSFEPGSYKTTCPKCSHTRKKKSDPCLSITINADETALWYCHNCEWKGAVGKSDHGNRQTKIYKRPKLPEERKTSANMLAWFKNRGISEETVQEFGCYRTAHFFPQRNGKVNCIAFPYTVGGEVVNVKYRADVEDPHTGAWNKIMAQESEAQPCFFNADNMATDEVIFAEGETDVMSLWEAGYRSVVSLPNGAGKTAKFDAHDLRFVPFSFHAEQVIKLSKVIIATDMDAPGEALAKEIAWRVGADRCFRANWPDDCKDANEVLVKHGAEKLRDCINSAAPWPLDGIMRPVAFRDDVFAIYRGEIDKGLSTGFLALDPYVQLMPCSFNVITGFPNYGKSTFMNQLCLNLSKREGWRWAVFSPEQTPRWNMIRLAEMFLGKSFNGSAYLRMTEAELAFALEWIDKHFVFLGSPEAAPTIEWLLERARYAAVRYGINGLVIDPWNEVEQNRSRYTTETEWIGGSIGQIKRFNRAHEVSSFVVAHPSKPAKENRGQMKPPGLYDISGSQHWVNKADLGLVVHRDDDAGRTDIHIRKVREQPTFGKLGTAHLRFSGTTRRFEEIEEPAPGLGFGSTTPARPYRPSAPPPDPEPDHPAFSGFAE